MKLLVISTHLFIVTIMSFMMTNIGSGFADNNKDGDVYNVLDYGATGNDKKDDSQAFLKAWNAACNAETGTPKVVIPENRAFLVFPVTFEGPCKPQNISFLVLGAIVAPNSTNTWRGRDAGRWLVFANVTGLTVDGFGTIDGRGKCWWDQSCKLHPKLDNCTRLAPTALSFVQCNGSRLSNIHFANSPQTHINIGKTSGFSVDKLIIQSPKKSPNTDGIHIQAVHHLAITNSVIRSGDDCISVGDHTSDVKISNITCGPGHGISIGSLGKKGNFVQVSDIRVSDSLFEGTTNGARIKTWQVGKGYVRDITFRNLLFINAKNPIIIDQNYCSVRGACDKRETGVKISNVTYMTMSGTSGTPIAINLNCSSSVPCSEILMQSIHLEAATAGRKVTALCTNAHGREIDVVPGPCLLDSTSTSPMRK